jgi:hypothetical protein
MRTMTLLPSRDFFWTRIHLNTFFLADLNVRDRRATVIDVVDKYMYSNDHLDLVRRVLG